MRVKVFIESDSFTTEIDDRDLEGLTEAEKNKLIEDVCWEEVQQNISWYSEKR